MSALDIQALLEPISPDDPGGPDLAFDPAYLELERAAEGTPEQRMGDSVIEAKPPDWRDVQKRALDLLGRSKDLRLLVLLTIAQLDTAGIPGLRDALVLLRSTLETCWDQVHPRLDPADDNDPTERMNILATLAAPPGSFEDRTQFVRKIREVPLTSSPRVGRFSLRDIAVAEGEAPPPQPGPDGETPQVPDTALIDAAFDDTDAGELGALAEAAATALEEVRRLDAVLGDAVGPANAVSLTELEQALKEVETVVRRHMARRGMGEPVETAADAAAETATGAPAARPGEVRTREDVVQALDRVCRYYDAHEPSSPIPLLLKRAQRLVHKDFIDIMRDMSPDALGDIERIGGERYRED